MKKMSTVDWIAWTLVIVGALNWGLVGVSGLNLVQSVLGTSPSLVQLFYILVGVSGLYSLWMAMGKK